MKPDNQQKTPIRKYNSLLCNCFNYGVFFLGYIIFYILLSVVIQFLFNCQVMTANIVSNVIMTVFSFTLYFGFRYHKKLPSFQSYNKSMTLPQLLCWFVYFILVSYVLLLLFQWFSLNIVDESMIQRENDMQSYSIVFYLFYSCILAPLAEESIMRLYAYNQLKRSSNWIVAMIVSSFVFAILHGTFTHAIIATLFGVVLTLSYECTGCFYMPILGHLVYNFMALSMTNDMFFAENNILVALCVIIFVSVILLQIFFRQRVMKTIDYKDMLK